MFTSEETSTRAAGGTPTAAGAPDALEDRRRVNAASLIDPVYVARSVWKARLLILAATIAGIAIAVILAVNTPKRYVATTQILMDPRDLKVVANEITPNGLPSDATLALIESQTSVIMSSNVLSRVIAEARLDQDPEFNGTARSGIGSLATAALQDLLGLSGGERADPQYETLAQLRHALTVSRETKSFVINLSVDSEVPDKAARIANLTAGVFIDEQGRVQSETARRATAAITARLSELRKSVVNAEQAVEDYKSQNALIGVGGRLVDDDYITRINDQLAKARGDITALRVKAQSMRGASVEDVVRGTLPEELSSEALVRLRQTYSDLSQQAAVLATKLGARHPQRIASEGALRSSRQAIAAELARIVAAAQTELARAETTERDLTAQIADLKEKQVTTSGSFVKLRELEREVEASRAVYEAFLLRARETGEQESLNTANVRVISEATPPQKTDGMSRRTMVIAGGMLGFIAGVGLAALFATARLLRAVFADRRRSRRPRWTDEERAEAARAAAVPAGAVAAAPANVAPPAFDSRRSPSPTTIPAGDAVSTRAAALAAEDEAAFATRQAAAARRAEAEAEENDRVSDAARRARVAMRARSQAQAAPAEPAKPEAPAVPQPDRPSTLPARTADRQATVKASESPPSSDLPLASVGGHPVPAPERISLRDRVRALSQTHDLETEQKRRAEAAPGVASLQDEIETVKRAIADIRRRRGGGVSET